MDVRGAKTDDSSLDKAAVRKEVINDLGANETLLGFDAARLLSLKKGDTFAISGKQLHRAARAAANRHRG